MTMRLPCSTLRALFCTLLLLPLLISAQQKPVEPPTSPILGFSPPHAAAERQLEETFQSIPSPDKARAWHRLFTAEPHPAASARNNQLAEWIADEWRKQ